MHLTSRTFRSLAMFLLALALSLGACQKQVVEEPRYATPLPPGAFALRKIEDPSRRPDLTPLARQLGDPACREALGRSLRWFGYRSSRAFFPIGPISHEQVEASLFALRALADEPPGTLSAALDEQFDVWASVGWDGRGTVLLTGYYSPIFRAARTPTPPYRFPIYKRPDDLVSDPATGETRGRQTDAGLLPYPTRSELVSSGALAGLELVYLPSRLDAYLIEVNGSARLHMTDGSTLHVGYAGNNGHDYTSIGRLLVADGKLDPDRLSLPALRRYFDQHPDELEHYIRQNDRFVFFTEYDGDQWPAGSLGFRVTPMRTLATDKAIFPRGAPVWVETTAPTETGGQAPFRELLFDQDTGGAIRAAGRGDIYFGIGPRAERLAGRQSAEGRMYYLLLKPEYVSIWQQRLRSVAHAR